MKIFPYLDIYMSANEEHLDDIRKLQYRALRICLKVNLQTPRVELLAGANLPLIGFRSIAHLRNYMYKRSKTIEYLDNSNGRTRAHDEPLLKFLNLIPKRLIKVFW